MHDIPWVEKYRPPTIERTILSQENDKIIKTILQRDYVPNMLLYGPPGTGKTTTVVQIINEYQKKHDEQKQGLMIHLNASDERGVEIIRTQINTFVTSKTFFGKGLKFVVLDEVDYMTKNAQQALTYVLQEHNENVRFFLMCNYISKIEDTLQSYFIKMNFNYLPKDKMVRFLKEIAVNESLELTDAQANNICALYHSDVRSMINYLQLNKNGKVSKDILNTSVWHKLYGMVKQRENINIIGKEIQRISLQYNTDSISLLKEFLNYAIVHFDDFPLDILPFLAKAIHGNALPHVLINYVFLKLLQAVPE